MSHKKQEEKSIFGYIFDLRSLLIGLLLISLFSFLFRHFPALDMKVAGSFYDNGFIAQRSDFWLAIRRFSIALTKVLAVFFIGLWLWRFFFLKSNQDISFAKLIFATISLLTGPLIITNLIFKEQWGRPRPKHLQDFGGEATFTSAWDISSQCLSNCSFVSGETSSALWLLTLIPFLPVAWHMGAVVFTVCYTILISALRMAFGAHFLSDVIFSSLFNFVVFTLVFMLVYKDGFCLKPREWANEKQALCYFTVFGKGVRTFIFSVSRPLVLAYLNVMDKVREKSI